MTQVCPNCHTASDVPTRFCTSCGAPMPEPEAPTVVHPAAPASGSPPPWADRRVLLGGIALVAVAAVAAGVVALTGSSGKGDATTVIRPVVTVVQTTPPVPATTEPDVPTDTVSTPTTTTPTTPEPAPEPAPPQPVVSPESRAKTSIKKVIRRHWANIESGDYAAAFAALAPGTQPRSQWIDGHQQDALSEARVSLGAPRLTSSTTATVPVLSLRTRAASGCNDWRGHYEMVKLGGVWKINKAKIAKSPC
jgi:hypothetical protein